MSCHRYSKAHTCRAKAARGANSEDDPMTLTEALSGSRLAGAERSAVDITVLIHCRSPRYHLTPSAPDRQGRSQAQRWVFPNLYDLLVFARSQGFAEVDTEATDWRTVSGSS